MDIMEVLGPMLLFIGVVCVAAAIYFVVTAAKAKLRSQREGRRGASDESSSRSHASGRRG